MNIFDEPLTDNELEQEHEGDLTLDQFKKRIERHEGALVISNEDHQLEALHLSSGKILIMFNSQCFYAGKEFKTALKHFNHFKSKYKIYN